MRRALTGVMCLASLSLACGDEPPMRTTIAVYTSLEQARLDAYLQSFYAQVPDIQLEIVRDSPSAIADRLIAEKDAPYADVVWGVPATALLAPEIRPQLVAYSPAGVERVRAPYRDPATPPTWVGIDAYVAVLCVNVPQLDHFGLQPPKSLGELADPKYQGLIAMASPKATGAGHATLSSLVQRLGEDLAFQYLAQLDRNVAVYTRSGARACQLAKEGTSPIGVSFDAAAVAQQPAVTTIFPSEGSGWEVEANALIRRPQVLPAARRFLDWAIGDLAMADYGQHAGILSVQTGAPPPRGFPADLESHLGQNDLDRAGADRGRLVERWQAAFGAKTEP